MAQSQSTGAPVPAPPREAARLYWCFTLNNPTFAPDDLPTAPREKYVCWQREEAESGTIHLQGYLECSAKQRLSALKRWLPRAHFEPRRGTAAQARDYAMKEDTRLTGPWERGVFEDLTAGKRTDLEDCRDFLLTGASFDEAAEKFPGVFARHPHFLRHWIRVYRDKQLPKQEIEVLRPWQGNVIDMIQSEPSERQILWLYDASGGTGKTMLGRYLVDHYGAFYSNGGKHTDICYAYDGQRVAVFDYVRESEQYVNYGVLEQIKNGILFSPKYESGLKRFPTPHVVVMANFYPASGKLSEDRLVVIQPHKCGDFTLIFPST